VPLEAEEISPGLRVRLLSNALKHGILTGKTKETNRGILAEVDFGPAEKSFKRIILLDSIKEDETTEDLILSGRFGSIRDFRSRLSALKVGGDLTDIFYSLGQDRTTFYPHQFLPVLKFIQSVPGRLLIADEVGLGKTIEAAYIWKEIEARHDAHTWLIICPSVLKEKWRDDLLRLFSMEVDIVSGHELLKELKAIDNGDRHKERIMIASIEGIRINESLWQFIDQAATNSSPLLDLVTVDEAHHLRNPGTRSHQIVASIREIATHLLLLSATPIQTESLNLYNLLKILEPDDFDDQQTFELQIEQNRYIVEAIRSLSSHELKIDDTGHLLEEALELHFFKDNPLLINILSSLADLNNEDRSGQLKLAEELEKVSLFHRFINRTRKRDVMSTHVVREAHEIEVRFNDEEKSVYDRVSAILQSMSEKGRTSNIFALIMRQRQMASSLPAAIRGWKKKSDDSDQIWEDFGMMLEEEGSTLVPLIGNITDNEYKLLSSRDSKYKALYELLDEIRTKTPLTKIVLFSFFRETLAYLNEKLSADGFSCMLFRGGIKNKTAVITEFKDSPSIQVLLSSEIGSEGVDLQFCRILINFDLPWNPMRVEQRIGRIDRIGQDAEKILIYNFVREDSIEERILYRLLDRIGIFRNSIGELEEIFGSEMERLAKDLFNPHLTAEQRENRVLQTEDALTNRNRLQKELEDEAWQLSGLTDYLISQIDQKREAGHWVRPSDLKTLTIDYLESDYPGCQLENGDTGNTLLITLSRDSSGKGSSPLFISFKYVDSSFDNSSLIFRMLISRFEII
jgi:SNF2 family DNA or RNA helicase